MSIKLKGSSDGSVSFDAPADTSPSGSDITLVLPTTVGSAEQFLKNSGTAGTLEFSSMVEDSSGNVGIGTASPTSLGSGFKEVIVSGATEGAGLQLQDTDGNVKAGLFTSDVSGAAFIRTITNHPLAFRTNNTERLRIDSSGNVCIGKTSADALLDVNGQARFGGNKVTLDTDGSISGTISNSTTRAFVLSNTNVNADYFGGRVIQIGPDGTVNIGGSAGTSPSSYSSPNIKLNPAGSSYINGGNVGIGTTSPTALLHLNATSPVLRLTGSSVGNCEIQEDGSTLLINVDSSNAKSSSALAFRTDNSERARITTDGLTFNGDTAAANALSDYEEGTFTPTVQGNTNSGTVSYNTRLGKYTKVGDRVFFEIYVDWTSGTGSGNSLQVHGLPFTAHSSSPTYPATTIGYWYNISFAQNSSPGALVSSGNSYVYFYSIPNSGGQNTLIGYDSAGSMILSGHYKVN